MLDRVAADERIVPGGGFGALLGAAPETATVLRVAARAGRLAGEADGGARPAEALVHALRGGELPPSRSDDLDLALFESDQPLAPLFDRLAATGGQVWMTGTEPSLFDGIGADATRINIGGGQPMRAAG